MQAVRRVLAVMLVLGVFFVSIPNLYADETSELILKLLVKKGVISQQDVEDIKAEISERTAKIPDVSDIQKHVKKASWADKIKFKGDIRLRNEYQRPGSGAYVNRQRIRARAGLEAKVAKDLKAGVMLATGGTGNARSTNQTFTDVFGTKAFDLDMAYLEWKPVSFMKLTGGKYKNPLYRPGDLLWDGDLRFEGVSANVKYPLKEELGIPADLLVNAGMFALDDLAIDKKNPWLYAVQGGLGASLGEMFDFKSYFSYLDFAHIKGTRSDDLVPTTGQADADGFYLHDYNVIGLSGDLTVHLLEQEMEKPFNVPVTFFMDYAKNVATDDKPNAWELGVKLGKKPKRFGDWRFVYNYRALERNAFPDEFPDADSLRGRTDGFGHESIFSLGITKNVWLEFDYYLFRDKTRGTEPNDKWGSIFQTDLNAKF